MNRVRPQHSIKGLSQGEARRLIAEFGPNVIKSKKQLISPRVREVITEPMLILLLSASVIYFLLSKPQEGIMTMLALMLVAAISVFQGIRSTRAIEALKDLTEPRVRVIRDDAEQEIPSQELVPGDVVILEEGEKIPADGEILKANDLLVNESVITGESLPVEKKEAGVIFQGTVILGGMCYARVTATGNNTVLGKIGKSIEELNPSRTALQISINRFVRRLALFGLIGFSVIWLMNYIKTGELLYSLLSGLTLIMAAIPEEIPVALSSFMALGAYRLSKFGIITRQPVIIENLGAVSVICVDKTGTITQNRMEVKSVYDYNTNRESAPGDMEVMRFALMASEEKPFDEMEKALKNACSPSSGLTDEPPVHEYSLEGHPPMMTHVLGSPGKYVIAAKGAPERILRVCHLDEATKTRLNGLIQSKAGEGHRIIAVAGCHFEGELPGQQDDFPFEFKGLIFLFDPPKVGIEKTFAIIKKAGIGIRLITGDYPQTAKNIALQAGIETGDGHVLGDEVMTMPMETLKATVKKTILFARMYPEAKVKVIEALKSNGEIVAMTGDGVNDGPALKASHIGIAMGKSGTQIARIASDIILTDDDLSRVTQAIRHGRKIFLNLKKAIRYIISIHIPIILTASLPLLLGWKYPDIFTPIHVIFLELIMGPTCSVMFENEPEMPGLMEMSPRKKTAGLFTKLEIATGILQGLLITAGTLWLYYHYSAAHSLGVVRAVVFTNLLVSNLFLTITGRSFNEPFYKTIRYPNGLVPVALGLSCLFIAVILLLPAARNLFEISSIGTNDLVLISGVSFISVFWIEAVKTGALLFRNKRT